MPQLHAIDTVLFDLDGTLYTPAGLIPGAVEVVQTLKAQGLVVRFVTNTTSRSRSALAERLRALGFPVEAPEIYSPTWAAGAYLRARGARACLLVPPGALEDFADVPIDDEHPDYVVIGDLGEAWTFEKLNRAFRLILEQGAQLIGLGRTKYWQGPDGLRLDVGPFVAALEEATGRPALILGKPAPAFWETLLRDLSRPTERVVMVGDDIEVDVAGAQRIGLRGVLVRTGKFRPADLERGIQPDAVLASVAELPALIFARDAGTDLGNSGPAVYL
ncbi:MAG: TIGR01458 family HAD-type hydrolase [Acidobacteria bacterium]|nr:TIGR01458 family HAD-type hydrolase [Acidobacteriota bacterium]MDW7983787.1 TIGR01458 family HAD-type hydrolase [Acidobacteriota bacterium]